MENYPDRPSLPAVEIGKWNKLRVEKRVDFGVFLDAREFGNILMPKQYVPQNCTTDDVIDAFLYVDSEDRFVATNETPLAMADELAVLKVVEVTPIGAFLDWGLPKDLLVPYREQKQKMIKGKSYIVYIYFDKSSARLVASAKTYKFIGTNLEFKPGDEVDLIIGNGFNIGYNVVINKRYQGVIFRNEVFQYITEGQAIKGYIKQLREDGKIDVTLLKPTENRTEDLAEQILSRLKSEGGFLPLADKSPPKAIYTAFQASKKAFKRAIGILYKQKLLTIEEKGIRLIE
ncbi:MAG: GntR family transcriptional regulator [Fibrobacteria bacterium]|nr:GntR family transcriptional regulator [Fibrobacteria bacterium]